MRLRAQEIKPEDCMEEQEQPRKVKSVQFYDHSRQARWEWEWESGRFRRLDHSPGLRDPIIGERPIGEHTRRRGKLSSKRGSGVI